MKYDYEFFWDREIRMLRIRRFGFKLGPAYRNIDSACQSMISKIEKGIIYTRIKIPAEVENLRKFKDEYYEKLGWYLTKEYGLKSRTN